MNRQRYVRVIRQADKDRDRQIGRQAERQTDIEIVERTDINRQVLIALKINSIPKEFVLLLQRQTDRQIDS